MAIVLPKFESTSCQILGVCFKLAESAVDLPSKPIDKISSYPGESGEIMIRLLWDPKSRHFHIDVALRTAFKNPPTSNTNITAFQRAAARFSCRSAAVMAYGSFVLPVSSLSPVGGLVFVGNSTIRLKEGSAAIELTGATLKFSNSPIRQLQWELVGDSVVLDIDANRQDAEPIGKDYLHEALGMLDLAVSTYILRNNPDGNSSRA